MLSSGVVCEYMKKFALKSILSSIGAVALALVFAAHTFAITPTLSLVNNGYGTYQVNVYGDANMPVVLDYYSSYNQLVGAGVIGYTNYSGSFTAQINPASFNIPNGAQVLVVVNGQQSQSVIWQGNGNTIYPVNNGYNNGIVTLSQSSVALTTGQTQLITINNNNGYNNGVYNYNQYYISGNLSTGVVSATVSGNTITLYGQNVGTLTLSVCANANTGYGGNGCASLYITVTAGNYYNNYNNYQYQTYPYTYPTYPTYQNYPYYPQNNYYNYNNTPISVSNSNVQVTVGSTATVSLYGGNNNYSNNYYDPYNQNYNNNYNNYGSNGFYISNATNSTFAMATISGNTLTIYGTNPGITTVTVCQTGGGQCATVNITIMQSSYYQANNYYPQQNYNGWYYSNSQHCWLQH